MPAVAGDAVRQLPAERSPRTTARWRSWDARQWSLSSLTSDGGQSSESARQVAAPPGEIPDGHPSTGTTRRTRSHARSSRPNSYSPAPAADDTQASGQTRPSVPHRGRRDSEGLSGRRYRVSAMDDVQQSAALLLEPARVGDRARRRPRRWRAARRTARGRSSARRAAPSRISSEWGVARHRQFARSRRFRHPRG
jgi:hypothetical protein